MSFLAPLFLLGAAAVAVPILFHLIRRTTRERTPFSSLMFLQPSPPRLTRRSRLEHLLLLALRCAVICLLALGFARPFFKQPVSTSASTGARRILVLVDSSASMRRPNLWRDARAKVASVLEKTSQADEVSLCTFDRTVKTLISFEQWRSVPGDDRMALAERKLADAEPGWSSAWLDSALVTSAEALADSSAKTAPAKRELILITDLKQGSRIRQLQGYEWPKDIQVTLEELKPARIGNAGIQLVTAEDNAEPENDSTVRLRVSNAPDSKSEQFKIGWSQQDGHSFAGQPVAAYVPPGQSRIVRLPAATNGPLSDRIILQGDDEEFDNTVFITASDKARLSVLYYGDDTETDPRGSLYFLKRAFRDTQRRVVELVVHRPAQPLAQAELNTASLFILTTGLEEPQARALREQLTAGKSLLVTSGAAAGTLRNLLGLEQLEFQQANVANYAMLAELDFQHPLFAPFADPRFSDFSKIHFWKYSRLDPAAIPGAHVLAKFDSGDPGLLEVPVGKGKLFLFTSGWRPDDSQLALSTKFVPLVNGLLDQSGGPEPLGGPYHVGDLIPLSSCTAGADAGALTLTTPNGAKFKVSELGTNFSQTLVPGIYTVGPERARLGATRCFAVNIDPAESATAPLPVDELERLGVPLSRPTPPAVREPGHKARVQNAELESRQKLWRIALLATLALLFVETAVAGIAARRRTAETLTPG